MWCMAKFCQVLKVKKGMRHLELNDFQEVQILLY